MQFSSIILMTVAAFGSGALAAPQPLTIVSKPVTVNKPVSISKPVLNPQSNQQTISCGNSATAYCCSATPTGDGASDGGYSCSKLSNTCNNIAVCCNNNNNGQSNSANQYCSAFSPSVKVIWL